MVDIVPILRFRTGLKSFTLLPFILIRVTLISFVFFLPEIIPNGIPGSLNPAGAVSLGATCIIKAARARAVH